MNDTQTDLPPWASRQAALMLGILESVAGKVQSGEPADRALRRILGDKKKYGARDRRLFGDAVFTWFRWYGAVGSLPLARGLCTAWFLDARPRPPAITAVHRDLQWPEPDPLQPHASPHERKAAAENAFNLHLPDVHAWLPDWVKSETEHLGPLEDRIRDLIQRPPTWLRVDRHARPELHQPLLDDGAEWAGQRSPEAYAFSEPGKVHQWLQKHRHTFELQDLASQQAVRVCNPNKGESWWDACCGAGGKSLQLLDFGERDIDLTCTDRREHVLKELTRRGRHHGLARVRRYPLDLLKSPQLPNIAFDGILLDAPCSGAGTWARSPDTLWRTTERDIRQHHRRQLRMLDSVLPTLKPRGSLVYAVCSLLQSETLDVTQAFLQEHPQLRLSHEPHPLTGEPTDGHILITPAQSQGDGMYIAKFV